MNSYRRWLERALVPSWFVAIGVLFGIHHPKWGLIALFVPLLLSNPYITIMLSVLTLMLIVSIAIDPLFFDHHPYWALIGLSALVGFVLSFRQMRSRYCNTTWFSIVLSSRNRANGLGYFVVAFGLLGGVWVRLLTWDGFPGTESGLFASAATIAAIGLFLVSLRLFEQPAL